MTDRKPLPDAVVCPVCGQRLNCITAGHYRKHGFSTAASFKQAFGLSSYRPTSGQVSGGGHVCSSANLT